MSLKDKVVLITGASQGIGERIAFEFASRGAKVAVAARTWSRVSTVADKIKAQGRPSLGLKANVAVADQVKAMFDKTVKYFGRLDVLVNNAAQMSKPSSIDQLTEMDWERVIKVNLTGPFLCSQQAARFMIPQHSGAIINITSIAAHEPYPNGGAYSASKAGLLILTQQCAVEWGCYNIRVNAVTPGLTHTPLTAKGYEDEQIKKGRERMIPLNRIGYPRDIAPAVVWLASDEAAYVTGSVIQVEGGFLRNIHGIMLGLGYQPGSNP